MNLEML